MRQEVLWRSASQAGERTLAGRASSRTNGILRGTGAPLAMRSAGHVAEPIRDGAFSG
jgi:hypothetical protein